MKYRSFRKPPGWAMKMAEWSEVLAVWAWRPDFKVEGKNSPVMLSGSGAMAGRGRVLATLAFFNYPSCQSFYILSILKCNTFRTEA